MELKKRKFIIQGVDYDLDELKTILMECLGMQKDMDIRLYKLEYRWKCLFWIAVPLYFTIIFIVLHYLMMKK